MDSLVPAMERVEKVVDDFHGLAKASQQDTTRHPLIQISSGNSGIRIEYYM